MKRRTIASIGSFLVVMLLAGDLARAADSPDEKREKARKMAAKR